MSKKEKLFKKLQSKPKDFTYDEAKTLLETLGFYENNKGKTSGSRVEFVYANKAIIQLHKPHSNGNILKEYQIKAILETLKKGGFLNEEYNDL